MKKWIVGAMSALFLATLVSVPVGCGPGKATKIEVNEEANKQPPGHGQAVKDMQKAEESGAVKK